MSKAPQSLPLDVSTPSALAGYDGSLGYQGAYTSILHDIDDAQHALMTEWGWPPHYVDCRLTPGDTVVMAFLAPPGVTECNLHFLVTASVEIAATTSADATGTQVSRVSDDADSQEAAVVISTAGIVDGGAATTGRAVTVRSSVTWTAANVTLTVTLDSGSTGSVYGVMVEPIHEVR